MCLSFPVTVIQVPFSQSKIRQITVPILSVQVPVSPVRISKIPNFPKFGKSRCPFYLFRSLFHLYDYLLPYTTVFIMCLSFPVIQVPFSQSNTRQIPVPILTFQVPVSLVRISLTIYNCLFNVSVIPSNTSPIFSVQNVANLSVHSTPSGPSAVSTVRISVTIQLSL